MTNLLSLLPEFDIRPFTHILPSLEKALISTADLLSLDAVDVAKRASVPTAEVKKLAAALLESLHSKLSVSNRPQQNDIEPADHEDRPHHLHDAAPSIISTLDERIDSNLGGGIASGYLTEIVGERYVESFKDRESCAPANHVQRGGQNTISLDITTLGPAIFREAQWKVSAVYLNRGTSTDNASDTDPQHSSKALVSSQVRSAITLQDPKHAHPRCRGARAHTAVPGARRHQKARHWPSRDRQHSRQLPR